MDLIICVYCSASAKGNLSTTELNTLLAECQRNNAKIDVTGMLLYREGSFFQVLEGERTVIEALLDKIASDKRHNHTVKIISEPITNRSFGDWTMGYPDISSEELAQIPGLNDFFTQSKSYLELGESRAKTLLAAFKDGKWQSSLSRKILNVGSSYF